ncbi:Ubiquitin-conjugating enzyme E2 variant 3 [Caenorhabditis elegans]|uniref:Ubiquitin-conjugating enzyme E2 variant 3 n=1 Tax=Caenorhabditis elegans TaxID=6239 RepID=UB2V3_CAEEL|nr:Ubiquitin-conjugating enzyme E2 variant 3 [Caenorhabditis elegans]CAB04202.3 Ubiquitin-conjugating enzyme E2 variant 3 [Caenorhabditis elegans]
MSDQPGTSRPPLRAEPTPTKTATRRRARPIAIPSDETPRNEVTFLRPSEVPQRKPLPEYREPQPRKTVPKNVPLEDLHNYHREECLNVSIPHFINTEDLIKESQRVNGLISFRSTNFVDPSVILKEIKKKEEETVTLMDNDKNSIIDIVGDGINYEKLKKVEKSLCQIDIITEFMNRSRHLQGKKVNGCIMRIDETKQLLFHVIIDGPVGSIYEGGTFFADINIQPYQNHSLIPRVCFHTFIFHPNLGKYGNWDMRGIQWERRSNLEVLYNFIVEGMRNVKYDIERRNLAQLEDMSQPNISRLAKEDWPKFERTAREFVMKMAGGTINGRKTIFAETKKRRRQDFLDEDIDVIGIS